MGEGPEPVTAPAWPEDALFALLGELREEGFPIGVGEYLEAQAAAAACHRDGLGGDPRRLRNYLAPVVCTNPEQQQAFYRHFETWWVEHGAGRSEDLASPPLPPPPLRESELGEVVRKTRPWKWWAAAALGAAALAAGLIWGPDLLPLGSPSTRPARVAGRIGATARLAPRPRLPTSTPEDGTKGTIYSSRGLKTTLTHQLTAIELPAGAPILKVRVTDFAGRPLPGTAVSMRGAPDQPLADLGSGTISSVSVSSDGSRVMTSSGYTGIWDTLTAKDIATDFRFGGTTAAFSPDGARVTTAREDTAQVWDALTGHSISILHGHAGTVLAISFSPDGARVLTASEDKTAKVWDAATGAQLATLTGHQGPVLSSSFSPDGRSIVTASGDGTTRIWDAATGRPITNLPTGNVLSASFQPDGRSIVTVSNGTAQVWDLARKVNTKLFTSDASSVSCSQDGSIMATVSANRARLWNPSTGKLLANAIDKFAQVGFTALSANGAFLATVGSDNRVRIWSVAALVRPSTATLQGTSDAKGEISFPLDLSMTPQSLSLAHDGHHSRAGVFVPFSTTGGTLHVRLVPLNFWDRLLEHQDKIQAGLTLLPLVVAGPWLAWRVRRRRQLVLERRATREKRATVSSSLPEPRHELYRGAAFSKAQVEMRRHRRAGPGDFDAEATVEATVRRVGFFTPVFRSRLEVPVYLALIDRSGFRDQRTQMVDLLLDRLQAGGVDFDRYDFDRDPRRAAQRGSFELHRDLEELAGLYPGHRLAVFADGSGFTNPVTGRLAPWVETLFAAWSEKTLLTPVQVNDWGRRELDLAACGFAVLPANAAGVERLADALQREKDTVQRPLTASWQPPYPDLLAARPGRFLERHAPNEQDLDALKTELAFYLGPDGYRWLRTLAVYPELDWYLTLYLGLLLKRHDGRPVLDEGVLMALTRLPWLRHGSMPDWLRLHLLRDMPADDETAVRDWLRQLLQHRETGGSPFRLDVARPPEPAVRGLLQRLRRWNESRDWRRLLKDLSHAEPSDGPLRDQVFVTFLLGKKPSQLQVRAPSAWQRLAWEQGLRALGPRTGSVAVLMFFLAILGFALGGDLEYVAHQNSQAWKSRVTFEPLPPRASTVNPGTVPPNKSETLMKPAPDKTSAATQVGPSGPPAGSSATEPAKTPPQNTPVTPDPKTRLQALAAEVRSLLLPRKQAAMQETAANDIENGKLADALPLVQSFQIADQQEQTVRWKNIIATLRGATPQKEQLSRYPSLPASGLADLLGSACGQGWLVEGCSVMLRTRVSGLCLGIRDQGAGPKEPTVNPCGTGAFDNWRIVYEKESVRIISEVRNFCLGVGGAQQGDSMISVHECTPEPADRWRLLLIDESSHFKIENEGHGFILGWPAARLCLGVSGNKRLKAGAAAEVNNCDTANDLGSLWSLIPAGGSKLNQQN